MNPFFTIIVPTFNRDCFLSKTIESVLGQTFYDWELIIVDDGSTDNTKKIVAGYHDDRIRYIYQENSERSNARNNGIRNARGEYICFLDSDDYYLSGHINSFCESIIKNKKPIGFFFTNVIREYHGVKKNIKVPYDINSLFLLLFKNIITPGMVCIHKNILIENPFIEEYKKAYWEDTHLWIRIALSYPIYYIDNYTCVQVEHKERSINAIERKQLALRYLDHISMVRHLFKNYGKELSPHLDEYFYNEYLDNRHRMFLFMSRVNKYLFLSLKIWKDAWKNKPSKYLLKELLFVFLNCSYMKRN
jgi:glycosyltransferase involved in cell wall biosynthesis